MGNIHASNAVDLGHEVVGGVDLSAEAREAFAEEFSAATYEDPADLVASESLDGVVVTVPNRFHAEVVETVLASDLPVLCEKPLAHTVDSAESIADAAALSDGWIMLGVHNRFAPGVQKALAHRDAGDLGTIQHVRAQYIRQSGVPRPGSWFTTESLAGGGALIDIGVHALDLALYVLDFPDIKWASASTKELTDSDCEDGGWGVDWEDADSDETIDVERAATAYLECEGGKSIVLDVAWATNQESTQEFIVRGSDGGVQFDLGGGRCDLVGVEEDKPLEERPLQPSDDQHHREMEAFTDALAAEAEAPPTSGLDSAMAVQRALKMIYEAADETVAASVSGEVTTASEGK